MSYFGTIYADTELPSRARAVYMYLRDRSDAEGKCWPGIKTIASDMKLSRSTVKRAVSDLEKAGYLVKAPRYRPNGSSTSNLYTVKERESGLYQKVVQTTFEGIEFLKPSTKGRLRSCAGPRGGSL